MIFQVCPSQNDGVPHQQENSGYGPGLRQRERETFLFLYHVGCPFFAQRTEERRKERLKEIDFIAFRHLWLRPG